VFVERDGQICACGKQGCLEAVAAYRPCLTSDHKVFTQAKKPIIKPGQDMLSLSSLIQAAEDGDHLAGGGHQPAPLIIWLGNQHDGFQSWIFLIIIGGEVVQMGEHYFAPLRKSLQ
jgi:predicted NBD/HSP70 family sugar kinase